MLNRLSNILINLLAVMLLLVLIQPGRSVNKLPVQEIIYTGTRPIQENDTLIRSYNAGDSSSKLSATTGAYEEKRWMFVQNSLAK